MGDRIALHRADQVLAGDSLVDFLRSEADVLREVANWVRDYLTNPHPDLGRSGEVCPWVRRGLELGAIFLAPISVNPSSDIDAILLALMNRLLSLEPTSGVDSYHRSLIAIFAGLDPSVAADFIVTTHSRLKPTFLKHGLMLGDFYPTCDKGGRRNRQFRPLRSPIPLLVIRPMVEVDVEFLLDRDEFVELYLATYGARGIERLNRLVDERDQAVEPERIPALRQLLAKHRAGPGVGTSKTCPFTA
jgi:hypothetical protein